MPPPDYTFLSYSATSLSDTSYSSTSPPPPPIYRLICYSLIATLHLLLPLLCNLLRHLLLFQAHLLPLRLLLPPSSSPNLSLLHLSSSSLTSHTTTSLSTPPTTQPLLFLLHQLCNLPFQHPSTSPLLPHLLPCCTSPPPSPILLSFPPSYPPAPTLLNNLNVYSRPGFVTYCRLVPPLPFRDTGIKSSS